MRRAWTNAKTNAENWWAKQGVENGRRKRYLVGAFILVTLLCFGLLPEWLKSLTICAGAAVAGIAGYRNVMRKRRASGNSAPINGWFVLGIIVVSGFMVIAVVIPTAVSGVVGMGAGMDVKKAIVGGLLLLALELIAIVATLILTIRQIAKMRSNGGTRSVAVQVADAEWAGADAKTLELVGILRTPKLINPELYKAGLYVSERPTGIARRRDPIPGTLTDTAIAMYAARPREGVHTVNGEKLTLPRLVSIVRTAVGPIAFFTAIPGATEASYDRAASILEVSMRVLEIRVAQLPDDRAKGVIRMSFVVHDPLEKAVRADFFDIYRAITPMLVPLAMNEEGCTYSMPLHHTLIVGATGSGKGGVIQALLRQLAPWRADGYVRIFGADPKRAELKGFERSSLFEQVAFDITSIAELAEFIVTDVLRPRQEISGRSFKLSTDNPLVLFILDELSSLTQDKNYVKSGLYENLNVILSQGRSDGVYVIAASQDGHKEVLGGLRQHFANRIALRVDTPIEVDMILGDGSMSLGAKPHLIPKANESNGYATAGIAYVNSDESPRPLRIRFPYTSDADIARLIADNPKETPDLGLAG
jgi:hypothetical protein